MRPRAAPATAPPPHRVVVEGSALEEGGGHVAGGRVDAVQFAKDEDGGDDGLKGRAAASEQVGEVGDKHLHDARKGGGGHGSERAAEKLGVRDGKHRDKKGREALKHGLAVPRREEHRVFEQHKERDKVGGVGQGQEAQLGGQLGAGLVHGHGHGRRLAAGEKHGVHAADLGKIDGDDRRGGGSGRRGGGEEQRVKRGGGGKEGGDACVRGHGGTLQHGRPVRQQRGAERGCRGGSGAKREETVVPAGHGGGQREAVQRPHHHGGVALGHAIAGVVGGQAQLLLGVAAKDDSGHGAVVSGDQAN